MTDYGKWKEKIKIGEKFWEVDLIAPNYAQKAKFDRIYAINGLPNEFEDKLVRASQVCDVPHTWRVRQCQSESEVTEDILKLGKEVLARDIEELHAHIITYVGIQENEPETFEFLAAGAIRDKLTTDYQNEQFPVVSRAIVAPAYRGRGLGSLVVEHRMKAVFCYFPKKLKAIHFGTKSVKILHVVKKVEQEKNLKFVHIGYEEYTSCDGTHTVNDYLCFMPWFREMLLESCDCLKRYSELKQPVEVLKENLSLFTTKGIEGVSGADLEQCFQSVANTLQSQRENIREVDNALRSIEELFLVKNKLGAKD